MMYVIFILSILAINIVLVTLGKKLNIINIVMQLVGAMIITPILTINYPELQLQAMASSDIVKRIYDICFVILIAYILHDSIDCKYQKKDMKLVIPSFFIPFISGFVCSILWLGEFNFQSAVVFGIIFSITAVPVLYMYLKGMNYSEDNIKFFIQAAIMIDIISWIAHSLVSDFHYSIIYLTIGAGILAFATYKINKQASGIVLLLMLMIASYLKSNVLLVGVICSNSVVFKNAYQFNFIRKNH